MKKVQVGETIKLTVIFDVKKIELRNSGVVLASGIAEVRVPYDQGYDTDYVEIKDIPLSQDLTGKYPVTL
jgi:hypothetical protein